MDFFDYYSQLQLHIFWKKNLNREWHNGSFGIQFYNMCTNIVVVAVSGECGQIGATGSVVHEGN